MDALTAPDVPRPLQPRELARLRTSCGHAFVPPAPASWGYRWYDLGGETVPFYLRRFEEGGVSASVALSAPLERLWGEDAEPGANAVALLGVTLGLRSMALPAVLDADVGDGTLRRLLDRVLDEVACLDVIAACDCPICPR
jgi:hypothetical protein